MGGYKDMNLAKYGQYKQDIFTKLNFPFQSGKTILDLGCGDGIDSLIFREEYKLKVTSLDIYKHPNINKLNLNFIKGSIFTLPFKSNSFDYVFLHDVLHHIDEPYQRRLKHIKGLMEANRVTRNNGYLIIVEGNRYNPLFYPHMVKILKHDHFRQSYFKTLINDVFQQYSITFKFFEAHLYPFGKNIIWSVYDWFMDNIMPNTFKSYNVAIVKK